MIAKLHALDAVTVEQQERLKKEINRERENESVSTFLEMSLLQLGVLYTMSTFITYKDV